MEITLEEIQKKFESLPEDIRWAIMGAKVDDRVIEIGQVHGLNVAQMGQLSLETHMVMLGFTHPDKFEKSLKESLKLGDEKTKEIVNDVNEKILKNIRESLMNLQKAGKNDNWEERKSAVTSAPAVEKSGVTEDKKDSDILKQAGIEIMPAELGGAQGKPAQPSQSLSMAKLGDAFKIPAVKTEYTLDNLSKNSGDLTKTNTQDKEPPKAGYAVDPYRMSPE